MGLAPGCFGGGGVSRLPCSPRPGQWYLRGMEVGRIVHAGQARALPVQVAVVPAVLAELQLLWGWQGGGCSAMAPPGPWSPPNPPMLGGLDLRSCCTEPPARSW